MVNGFMELATLNGLYGLTAPNLDNRYFGGMVPMNLKDEKSIGFTKDRKRQCRTCAHWLKLKQIPGAGACSSEEVCKKYRNQPIVVTDQYETCWCWTEDSYEQD